MTPTAYRAQFPPAAARAVVPSCVVRAYGRPATPHVSRRQRARDPVSFPCVNSSPPQEAPPDDQARQHRSSGSTTRTRPLAFYTEKLGWEVRSDVTMPEMGDFRWLTVGPADGSEFAIVLMAIPGPPVFEADAADRLRDLVAQRHGRHAVPHHGRLSAPPTRSSRPAASSSPRSSRSAPTASTRASAIPSGNAFRLTQVTEIAQV